MTSLNSPLRLSQLMVGAAFLLLGRSASAVEYFCPRANIALHTVGNDSDDDLSDLVLAGGGGSIQHFPKELEQIPVSSAADREGIWIKMVDCSGEQFLCKRVEQAFWGARKLNYLIVIPRDLVPDRSYVIDDIRVVTKRVNVPETDKAMVQAVVTQEIDKAAVSMSFTFQQDRGLIYWDEARFAGAAQPGELCILATHRALFSTISVK